MSDESALQRWAERVLTKASRAQTDRNADGLSMLDVQREAFDTSDLDLDSAAGEPDPRTPADS